VGVVISDVQNTGVGDQALFSNTDGRANTATSFEALYYNSTGINNTASGANALLDNTTGSYNTATGFNALLSNTIGQGNTANGFQALFDNTTGGGNAAVGEAALQNLTVGNNNTAIGYFTGFTLTTGSGNVYVGAATDSASPSDENHTYIRNINTTTVAGVNTDTVTVNLSTGLLGHMSSSRRYKEDIKPMENASETLYRLKPVTYRYKKEIDPNQSIDYGLVAEDVAKVDPNLANRNKAGQIESVRYSAINAMLLNEFLKEHTKIDEQAREIQEQKDTINELKTGMDSVVAQLREQESRIQRVSAQLELSKGATQTIAGKK